MKKNMTTYACILAGGIGSRTGHTQPKQFISINKKPLIVWTLLQFQTNSAIDHIIVTSPAEYIQKIHELCTHYALTKVDTIIPGGNTRQQSAYNALTCKDFNPQDIFLLHDAARPFITHSIINNCIAATLKTGAAGTYIPAVDTITEGSHGNVYAIPERSNLYYTQTPQCFTYSVIKKAHEYAMGLDITEATDDVSLVHQLPEKITISMVDGSPENIKITNALDIEIAEILLKR
jgi:ribitol-5-phosphate 2-dehydrogenase (NADP+) / D-ribitol-5-phosphate cytidylyltransferase